MVVPQNDADLVRRRTEGVAVRFAGELERGVPGRMVGETPNADTLLPSLALGTAAGGDISVDPRDADGRRSLERLFQFDVVVPEGSGARVGERAYVRLDHGREPLAPRMWRRIRQLFIDRLNV